MLRLAGKFLKSRSGSLLPIFAVGIIPMIAAVGLSVDYTDAVTDRGNMQDALDAATLGIMTLPTTTSTAARQQSLQDQFTANNGQGTVTLNSFTVAADGTSAATTSATYAMPTNFMQVAKVSTVQIGVTSSVTKTPALVQATFKIDKASGWWNKTIYLYGTQFSATTAQKLMQISYTYNGAGDPKGYGTTTVYTVSGTKLTQVQQQVCSTSTVSNFKNAPAGAIEQTSGNKNYLTTCTTTPANGSGAVIDVSLMGALYLEMDVPSGSPTVLKSNDPTTSDRLFIGTSDTNATEVAAGQTVDIFTAVPCGQTSTQAWEDGGSATPEPVVNADFFYTVTGKCDFNQRPSQTILTQ
jgi:Flp pilus assembly protein TadG